MNVVYHPQYAAPQFPAYVGQSVAALPLSSDKESRASIAQAISAIKGSVGAVAKDGHNNFHNYKYATASDVFYALQGLMAEHGLSTIPNERNYALIDDGSTLAVTYDFALVHTDGSVWPEKPIFTGMASARNSKGGFDDKAANKCMTAANKYFLINLFKIPTGDYADADDQEDRSARGRGAAAGGTQSKSGVAPAAIPAERPAAPVDPQTGEVSPHPLALQFIDNKPNFIGWGQLFIAAIDSAKTVAEIEAWKKDNQPTLERMKAEAVKIHARLVERVDRAATILAPKSDGPPDLSARLPKRQQDAINTLVVLLSGSDTQQELDGAWNDWVYASDTITALREGKNMLDRAAALYELNRKRIAKPATIAA